MTATQTTYSPTAEPTKTRVTIPTPAEIQAELDELAERRRHLNSLMKVSRRAYGETTEDEPDGDGD